LEKVYGSETKDEAKSLVELFFGEIKDALERRVAVKL